MGYLSILEIRFLADFILIYNGEYCTGRILYDGVHQFTHEPIKHKSTHDFINVDGKFGTVLLNHESFQIIPYVGFGFRYWKLSSHYLYYNYKALLGLKLNYTIFDNLVLSPYANVGTIVGPRAKFTQHAYPSGQPNGDFNLKLKNKALHEIGLEINYELDKQLFITGGVNYTRFGYGKSEKETTLDGLNYVSEPDSKTREIRIYVGIRLGFL